jgi:hypothetical protein
MRVLRFFSVGFTHRRRCPNWPTKNAYQEPELGSIVLMTFNRVESAARNHGGRWWDLSPRV